MRKLFISIFASTCGTVYAVMNPQSINPALLGSTQVAAAARCSDVETTDLVAYYKYEEGSGTSVNDDSSGGTHDLTLFNTPTWTTGMCGGGLNFASASTEYGTGASPPAIGDDDTFSICTWV